MAQSCKNCRRAKTCRQLAAIGAPGWCPQYRPTKKARRHGQRINIVHDSKGA